MGWEPNTKLFTNSRAKVRFSKWIWQKGNPEKHAEFSDGPLQMG
jgi:hypothetical protein